MHKIYTGSAAFSKIAELRRRGYLAIMTPRAQRLFGELPSRSLLGEPEIIIDGWQDEKGQVYLLVADRWDEQAIASMPYESQYAMAEELSKPEWTGWRPIVRSFVKGAPGILADIAVTSALTALLPETLGGSAVGAGVTAAKTVKDILALGRLFKSIGIGARRISEMKHIASLLKYAGRGVQALRRVTPLVKAGEVAVKGARAVRGMLPTVGRTVRGMVPTAAGSTAGWIAQELIQQRYTPHKKGLLPATVAGVVTGAAEHALHGLVPPTNLIWTVLRGGGLGGLGMGAYSIAEQLQQEGQVDVGKIGQAMLPTTIFGATVPIATHLLHWIPRRLGMKALEDIHEVAQPTEPTAKPKTAPTVKSTEAPSKQTKGAQVPFGSIMSATRKILESLPEEERKILAQEYNVKPGQLPKVIIERLQELLKKHDLGKAVKLVKREFNTIIKKRKSSTTVTEEPSVTETTSKKLPDKKPSTEISQPSTEDTETPTEVSGTTLPETPTEVAGTTPSKKPKVRKGAKVQKTAEVQEAAKAQEAAEVTEAAEVPEGAEVSKVPTSPETSQDSIEILANLGKAWRQRYNTKGDEVSTAEQLLQAQHLNAIYELLGKEKRVTEVTQADIKEILGLVEKNRKVYRILKHTGALEVLKNYGISEKLKKIKQSSEQVNEAPIAKEPIAMKTIRKGQGGELQKEESPEFSEEQELAPDEDESQLDISPESGISTKGKRPEVLGEMLEERPLESRIITTKTGNIEAEITPTADRTLIAHLSDYIARHFWPSIVKALKTKHKLLEKQIKHLKTFGDTEIHAGMKELINYVKKYKKAVRLVFSRDASDIPGRVDYIYVKGTNEFIPQITIYLPTYMEKLAQLLKRSDEALAEAFFTGSVPVIFHEYIHMLVHDLAFDKIGNLTHWGERIVNWAKDIHTWAAEQAVKGKVSFLSLYIHKLANIAKQTAKKTGRNFDVVFAEELLTRFATLQTYISIPKLIDEQTAANLQLMEAIAISHLTAWIKSLDDSGLFKQAAYVYENFLYPLLKLPISERGVKTDPSRITAAMNIPVGKQVGKQKGKRKKSADVLLTGLKELLGDEYEMWEGDIEKEIPRMVIDLITGNIPLTIMNKTGAAVHIRGKLKDLKDKYNEAKQAGNQKMMKIYAITMEILESLDSYIDSLEEDDILEIDTFEIIAHWPFVLPDALQEVKSSIKVYTKEYQEALMNIDPRNPEKGQIPLVPATDEERRRLDDLGQYTVHEFGNINQRLSDEILLHLDEYLRVTLHLLLDHPENLSDAEIKKRKQFGLVRLAELIKFMYISNAALQDARLARLRGAFKENMKNEFTGNKLAFASKLANMISVTLAYGDIIRHPEWYFGENAPTPVETWIRVLTDVDIGYNRPSSFFPPAQMVHRFIQLIMSFREFLKKMPHKFTIPSTKKFSNLMGELQGKSRSLVTTGNQIVIPYDAGGKQFIYYAKHTKPEVIQDLHKFVQTIVDNYIQNMPRLSPSARETMTNLVNEIGMGAVPKASVESKANAFAAALELFARYPELYRFSFNHPDATVAEAARRTMGILYMPYVLFLVGHFLPASARIGDRKILIARTFEGFLNLRLMEQWLHRTLNTLKTTDWKEQGAPVSPEDIYKVIYGVMNDIGIVATLRASSDKVTVHGSAPQKSTSGRKIPSWVGSAGESAQVYGTLLQQIDKVHAGIKQWRKSWEAFRQRTKMVPPGEFHLGVIFIASENDAELISTLAQRSFGVWEDFQNLLASAIDAWSADKTVTQHIKQINEGTVTPSLNPKAPVHELQGSLIWHIQQYASLMEISPDVRTWSLADFAGFLEYLHFARGTITIEPGDFKIPIGGFSVKGWSLYIIQEFFDRLYRGLSKEDRERLLQLVNSPEFPEMRWNLEALLNHVRYTLEDELVASHTIQKRTELVEDVLAHRLSEDVKEGEEEIDRGELADIVLSHVATPLGEPTAEEANRLEAAYIAQRAVRQAFKGIKDLLGIEMMHLIDAVKKIREIPMDDKNFWKLAIEIAKRAKEVAIKIQREYGFEGEDIILGTPFRMIRLFETLEALEKDVKALVESHRSGNIEEALEILRNILPIASDRNAILHHAWGTREAMIDYVGGPLIRANPARLGFVEVITKSVNEVILADKEGRIPELIPEEVEAWRRFVAGWMLFSGAHGGDKAADNIIHYFANKIRAIVNTVQEIDRKLNAETFYRPLLEHKGETLTNEATNPETDTEMTQTSARKNASNEYTETIEPMIGRFVELASKAIKLVAGKDPGKTLLHVNNLKPIIQEAIKNPQETSIPPNFVEAINQVSSVLIKIPDIVTTVKEFLDSEEVATALRDPEFKLQLHQELYPALFVLKSLVDKITPEQIKLLDIYWYQLPQGRQSEIAESWAQWREWRRKYNSRTQLNILMKKLTNFFTPTPNLPPQPPSQEAVFFTVNDYTVSGIQKKFIDALKEKFGAIKTVLNRTVGNVYRSWKTFAPHVGQAVEQIVIYLNRLAPVVKSKFASLLSAATQLHEQLLQDFPDKAQHISMDIAISLIGLNPQDYRFLERVGEFISHIDSLMRLLKGYAQHRQNNPKFQAREQIKVGWDNETPQNTVFIMSNLIQHRINYLAQNPEYAQKIYEVALAYRYALDKMHEIARVTGIGAKAQKRGEIAHLIDYLEDYYPPSPSQAGAVLLYALGDIWENMDPKEIQNLYGIKAEAAREIWRAISASQHVTSFSHQIQYVRHLPRFWLFIMSDPNVKVALHRYAAELGNLVAEHDAMAIVLEAFKDNPYLKNTLQYIEEFKKKNPDVTPPPDKIWERLVQDSVGEGVQIGVIGVDGYLNIPEASQQLAMFTQLLHGQFSPVNLHSYVSKGTFQKFVNDVNEIVQALQQRGVTYSAWQRGLALSHSPHGRAQYGRLLHTAYLEAPGLWNKMMSLSTLGVINAFSFRTGLVNLPEGVPLAMSMVLSKDRGFVAQLREIASSLGPLMRAYGKAFQWIASPEFRNIYRNLLRGKIDPEILAKVTDDPVLMAIFSRFIDTYYANIIGQKGAHQVGEFWLHWGTFFNFWEMLTLAKSVIFARSYLDTKKDIFLRFIRGEATPEDMEYLTRFLGELRLGNTETLQSFIHRLTTKNDIPSQDAEAIWEALRNYIATRFTLEIHHEYGALDMPELWHTSPVLNMALYWIRSYTLQQGNKIFEHFIKSPYKTPGEKLASALAAFIISALTYMGMSQVYSAIAGDYEEAPASLISPITWKGGIARALIDFLTSPTSPFGIISDTVYALDRMWNTYTPERAARVVFSPLMSLIADSFLTAFSTAQALLTRDEYSFDKVKTHAARLIPQRAVIGRFLPYAAEKLGGTFPTAEQTAQSLYAKLRRVYPLTREWSPNAHQNWITKLLPAMSKGNPVVLANLILQTRPGEIFEALQRGEKVTPEQFIKFVDAMLPVIQRHDPEEYRQLSEILPDLYRHLKELSESTYKKPSGAIIDLAPIVAKLEEYLIEDLSKLDPEMQHAVLQHLLVGAVEHAFHAGKLGSPSVPSKDFAVTLEATQSGLVPRLRLLSSMAATMGQGLFREGLIQLSGNSPETVDVFLHKFYASEDRQEAFSMIPMDTVHTAYRRAFKYTIDALAPITMLLFPQLVHPQVKQVYQDTVDSYRSQLNDILSYSSIRGLAPIDIIKAWEQVCQSEESIEMVQQIHEANKTLGTPFILRLRRFLQGGLTPVIDTLIDAAWFHILERGERERRKASRSFTLEQPLPQLPPLPPFPR